MKLFEFRRCQRRRSLLKHGGRNRMNRYFALTWKVSPIWTLGKAQYNTVNISIRKNRASAAKVPKQNLTLDKRNITKIWVLGLCHLETINKNKEAIQKLIGLKVLVTYEVTLTFTPTLGTLSHSIRYYRRKSQEQSRKYLNSLTNIR